MASDKIKIFSFLIFMFLSCAKKNDIKEFTLNKGLEKEILSFINKYGLEKDCDIHVFHIYYEYNYRAFNISTLISRDYGKCIQKFEIQDGYHVLFYTGLEQYIDFNQILRRNNSAKHCMDAGIQLTIDSAGIFKSYDNIGLFPSCKLPDIKDLLSKANHKE